MFHQPYNKEYFEADLAALGEVPSIRVRELGQVEDHFDRMVLADALGSSAVVLFQERSDCNLDETLQTNNALRPTERTLDERGISITSDSHAINLRNPYSLLAYFPGAADGRGDASFYNMPDFSLTLPDVSRYITEQEAEDLLIETAIPLHAGLFVTRPEAEAAHHNYYARKSMSRMPVEDYVSTEVPYITMSANPLTTKGSFTLLDTRHVMRGSLIQRLSYTGRAAMEGVLKGLPLYKRGEDNSILRLTNIVPGEVDHPEDAGVFTYSYIDRQPWSYDDFIGMMRLKEKVSGQIPLPPLRRSTSMHRALEAGLIGPDSLVYAPALATPILYQALTEGPDTLYFQNLRHELGPAFSKEPALIARARAHARSAWQAALAGQVRVEPIATGLEEAATRAGIRRQTGTSMSVYGGVVYIVDGNIVVHE